MEKKSQHNGNVFPKIIMMGYVIYMYQKPEEH